MPKSTVILYLKDWWYVLEYWVFRSKNYYYYLRMDPIGPLEELWWILMTHFRVLGWGLILLSNPPWCLQYWTVNLYYTRTVVNRKGYNPGAMELGNAEMNHDLQNISGLLTMVLVWVQSSTLSYCAAERNGRVQIHKSVIGVVLDDQAQILWPCHPQHSYNFG